MRREIVKARLKNAVLSTVLYRIGIYSFAWVIRCTKYLPFVAKFTRGLPCLFYRGEFRMATSAPLYMAKFIRGLPCLFYRGDFRMAMSPLNASRVSRDFPGIRRQENPFHRRRRREIAISWSHKMVRRQEKSFQEIAISLGISFPISHASSSQESTLSYIPPDTGDTCSLAKQCSDFSLNTSCSPLSTFLPPSHPDSHDP